MERDAPPPSFSIFSPRLAAEWIVKLMWYVRKGNLGPFPFPVTCPRTFIYKYQ